MELKSVGVISFDKVAIDVYEDLYNPIFRLQDIARMIGYRSDSASQLLQYCESDEYFLGWANLGVGKRRCTFVTEMGLYDILGHARTETARMWSRVVHNEIIRLRNDANRTITKQFEIWDEEALNIWFDEETGKMMEAINGPRGDVIIREYEE